MTRRSVTFRNDAGERLFGIFEEPEQARTDIGIVLLSPGVKSRVAPHRLYNKIAQRLVHSGFRVLRFDFAGLGDSEGAIQERLMPDLYRSIQLGRYVGDTLTAIDWMRTHAGTSQVVLGGLCGGALTGLLAAEASDHVAGLFGLGLPVILDGSTVDKVGSMSQGELRSMRRKYLAKVLDPSSWWRVITLRSDFRLVWRSLKARSRARRYATTASPAVLGDNANPRFSRALFSMLERRRPTLVVFGGSDRLYWEYREKFADPHAAFLSPYADQLEVRVIEQANHVLTMGEWQEEFFGQCERWLTAKFGDGGLAATMSVTGRAASDPADA
jgi:uncharacterized protein